MIHDSLDQASKYLSLHEGFRLGFEFLSRRDLVQLATGRHEIDGQRVFALMNREQGRGHAGARLEAHRKYIDIQFLVAGQEEIGWRLLDECRAVAEPYSAERDVAFYADHPQTWTTLVPGQFSIFFPHDAHAPLGAAGECVKVVIKVAVE